MRVQTLSDERLVEAARDGDRRAVEALAARYLPLVYTVVGRGADRDLDVDDIVQDTMVRVVTGVSGVRRSERFRSWVVTIALRQLADARAEARRQRLSRDGGDPAETDVEDPSADFVGPALLRQVLDGEQREIAEAARWLDAGFRTVLSLWWLEAGGHLSRTELAESLELTVAHTGVRVQRMREQLDVARGVVRALDASPGCPVLRDVVSGWNGEPDPLWRKRIHRHVRECATCGGRAEWASTAEQLLAGLPLLAPPAKRPRAVAFTVAAAAVAVVAAVAVFALRPQPAAPGHDVAPRTGDAPVAALASGVALPPSSTGGPSGSPSASSSPSAAGPHFLADVPAVPAVGSAVVTGPVRQQQRVAGRDNGQSTRYGDRSVWIFDDTTLKDPWGFLSNSRAVTADLDAGDGIDLTGDAKVPVELIPRSKAEKDYEQANHVQFGFWPGPVVADPARNRVLVFYGKLCRGGPQGSVCTGPLGKGLGTGIAAIDMNTGAVTRLTAGGIAPVSSVEGPDPTMFFPDGKGFSSAALTVDGVLYTYGGCTFFSCELAKVALPDVADRGRWTFWAGGGVWNGTGGGATIVPGAAGETVFYAPALNAWVNVYMPYGTNDVMFQVGGAPWGPWSKGVKAMTVPLAAGEANNYALFAHPEYAQQQGLVQYLTYFNPRSGEQRLVRLTFKKPG